MRFKTACLLGLMVTVAFPLSGMAKSHDLPTDLDAYIEKGLKDWNLPGLAIAIVKDDKVLLAKGYGVREAGKPDPVQSDTLFAIGSTSKAVTAAAVGIVVDSGKLTWETPVQSVWPEFKLAEPYPTKEIRVSDLLANRSGLSVVSERLWYGADFDRAEIMRRLQFVPLEEGFRYQFQYRNVMFLAAGQLIEKVDGRSWDRFITEQLFKPLGMKRTQPTEAGWEKLENVARPHLIGYDGKPTAAKYRNMSNIGPAGSILSNVDDMSRWVRMQLEDGSFEGKPLIKPETIERMHRSHTPIAIPADSPTRLTSYALGWIAENYRRSNLVWHNGGIDGMSAWVGLVPERDFGVVILSNLDNCDFRRAIFFKLVDHLEGYKAEDLAPQLLKTFHEEVKGRDAAEEAWKELGEKTQKPALPLSAYEGEYEHPALGKVKVTSAKEGGLLYERTSQLKMELRPEGGHEFMGRYLSQSEDLRSGKVDVDFVVEGSSVTGLTEDGVVRLKRVK